MSRVSEWKPPEGLGRAGETGLFGPETVTWRVYRENVLGAFGGARALILQVGHPLVAAGVGEHSDYRKEPWDRLFRTLDTVQAITFGNPAEAEEAARRVWNVHSRVKGVAPEGGGRYVRGTPYAAHDPELAMWVHATLVDTGLLVYDRYVRPLSVSERETFYEEQKVFAEMFGVPRARQPETYSDFNEYVAHMIEHELAVTDTLRDVVDATLVRPELPGPLRLLRPAAAETLKLLTTALLPPRMRKELGLSWGPGRERLVAASRPLVRGLLPVVPGVVREMPRARVAEKRLRADAARAPVPSAADVR